jgi:hypothetical protein
MFRIKLDITAAVAAYAAVYLLKYSSSLSPSLNAVKSIRISFSEVKSKGTITNSHSVFFMYLSVTFQNLYLHRLYLTCQKNV